jgi:hypothetical protein
MSKEPTSEQRAKKTAYMRQYRQDNRAKLATQMRQYKQEHKVEIAAYKRQYNQDNKVKIAAQKKQWGQEHKTEEAVRMKQYNQDHRPEKTAYNKQYNQDHKSERNVSLANRRADDIDFRLKDNVTRGIKQSIKGNRQCKHSIDLLGCAIPEVREYLERQFQPGMTWNNWSKNGWHIDHIIPLASFDFTDYEQQKQAWHYTNLRPLWSEENMRKHNKIIEIQLILL